MIITNTNLSLHLGKDSSMATKRLITVARCASKLFMIAGLALFAYSVTWSFATRRYLRGFADAIVPLNGSAQDKTEALLRWFRNEPNRNTSRTSGSDGLLHDRDPVNIVQNLQLLKVCGTATNAFMNLADAAGLKSRRLLLLDQAGRTKHVVAEVQWDDRWIVVNPQLGLIYKDQLGRALTKEELRNPKVFQDSISSMPGYDPEYTFEHTVHIRLARIPVIGSLLRSALVRLAPKWEEYINWSYFPENPSLWLIVISFPLLLLGILGHLIVTRYSRDRPDRKMMQSRP